MIKLPQNAIRFINKHFNNLDAKEKAAIDKNISSAEDVFNMEKVNDILDVISDYLNYHGFDENDQITDYGREIEKIYDEIYYNAKD